MKKIIVTHENYEEIMFELLEDQYPKEVREDILNQIHSDTLLSFEWGQWSKAAYSESTELYKSGEAEFIEGLTREEKKKRGFVYYLAPISIAASILLAVGFYFLSGEKTVPQPSMATAPAAVETGEQPQSNGQVPETSPVTPERHYAANSEKSSQPLEAWQKMPEIQQPVLTVDTAHAVAIVQQPVKQQEYVPVFNDTIKAMIASAHKRSKYKITIVEGPAGDIDNSNYKFEEKRYSMADVMNHKDGISLSKFLENPNSRIVTDKNTNKVTIEYMAEDHSILVINLSN